MRRSKRCWDIFKASHKSDVNLSKSHLLVEKMQVIMTKLNVSVMFFCLLATRIRDWKQAMKLFDSQSTIIAF